MCIRDRDYTLRFEQNEAVEKAIDYFQKTEKGEFLWNAKPCLLYTSDAADERSSVDLGGRRIIKKKKTITVGA